MTRAQANRKGRSASTMWPWRRTPDPEVEAAWQSFLRFAKALDEGSRALLAAGPSARRPGVPLEASVQGFLAGMEFEHRTEAIGEVLDELAPIQEAEQAFRALRRRR